MRKKKIIISILFALLLVSVKSYSLCYPDTLHIKPVIISGERLSKKSTGITTSRIDSVAMVKSMTSNLSDLMLQNTPVFIKEYGRGAMATASFRGTAPSHTQVLWNGISLNNPMLGMVDFSTIPVYFIDEVMLLHGSGSLSESSGALGGIVRLQTGPDFSNKFSGKALTGIGSFGTVDEMIRINIGNQKVQSQTRSFYNYSNNDFPFINKLNANIDPSTGNYLYSNSKNLNAAYRNYGFLQELYFRPSQNNLISARYWYQHNDRSLPRLLTNEALFPTDEGDNTANITREEEDAHRTSLEWKNYGEKGNLTVSSGLNIQNSAFKLKVKVFGSEDQYAVNSISAFTSSFNKVVYDYQIKSDLSISTGLNADFHEVNSMNSPFNEESYGYKKSRNEEALFISLNKNWGDKISATLLGRQNLIDGQASPFMPSFGIEYRPIANQGFYIKSNIARNYHQPTLNELYFTPGGNPNLKPEEGVMTDLGTGYTGKIGDAKIKTALTGYTSRIRNWIIWLPNPQGYWVPFNMKEVSASGIEFKTDVSGNIGLIKYKINSIYAFTRSINWDDPMNWADESHGKQLPYIPENSANILVDLSENGYHVNWSWIYYSKRYTTSSTDKDSRLDVIYPYLMNHFSAGKEIRLNKGTFGLELKIYNVFDEDYRTVLQNPMPGRNYSVLLRYDF